MTKREARLHGWDDEKIYLWTGKEEYCVSEDRELLGLLKETAIKFIGLKRKKKFKRPASRLSFP